MVFWEWIILTLLGGDRQILGGQETGKNRHGKSIRYLERISRVSEHPDDDVEEGIISFSLAWITRTMKRDDEDMTTTKLRLFPRTTTTMTMMMMMTMMTKTKARRSSIRHEARAESERQQ
jgi:hypothetical protein